MKSERRHDLETNQLAIHVKDWIDHVKPHLGMALGIVAAVAAAIALWSVWQGTSSARVGEAWDAYTLASYSSDPELMAMKRVADNEDYAGTAVPEWAYLAWCDRQLLLASQSYFIDRSSSQSRLKKIRGIFDSLATGGQDARVQDRAHYGLAQVLEMQDKIDEALQEYARVKGDLQALAKSRIEQLEGDDAKETYKWLASAELPKRPPADPASISPASRPTFDAEVPAASPNAPAATDSRTLEEVLLGPDKEEGEDNRYGEKDSSAKAADTPPSDSKGDESTATDSEKSETPAQ